MTENYLNLKVQYKLILSIPVAASYVSTLKSQRTHPLLTANHPIFLDCMNKRFLETTQRGWLTFKCDFFWRSRGGSGDCDGEGDVLRWCFWH